ncbi:hypothetical protein KPSA3_05782 [Pseudomonas syringae pv. actinidiae]|uniref:Uncharacterized protein n=1 Tax=Pseudomonas syringae pv. actinidiae TaxID=103796 RepID=A0AAN4Q978_PSESF|nr:hypothetical protein KPSA3_05782 [Pseudomonas syringae pv. actinidiae]
MPYCVATVLLLTQAMISSQGINRGGWLTLPPRNVSLNPVPGLSI